MSDVSETWYCRNCGASGKKDAPKECPRCGNRVVKKSFRR